MIFGIAVGGTWLIALGLTLLSAVAFQVLVGLRWIKLGRRRMKIHKWTGIGILAVACIHGFLGILFVTGWQVL